MHEIKNLLNLLKSIKISYINCQGNTLEWEITKWSEGKFQPTSIYNYKMDFYASIKYDGTYNSIYFKIQVNVINL